MSDGANGKKSVFHSQNAVNIAAIFGIAAFCVVVVILLAKGLFASNTAEVPEGINTATVSSTTPAETTEAPAESEAEAQSTETASAPAATSAAAPAEPEKAYITNYVQLLEEPAEDAAHIICMSPNIEVTVLERRDDGYVKLTFLNGDGTTCTGYVLSTFLKASRDEVVTEAPEETEAPAEEETEAPAETEAPVWTEAPTEPETWDGAEQ